jgi:hypothetical protein
VASCFSECATTSTPVDVHNHRAVGGRTVRFEKVLRIVIDQSGRIVTAFPSDKLIALGVTAAGIGAFSERTAKAAETVHASVEWQNALETAANADTTNWLGTHEGERP